MNFHKNKQIILKHKNGLSVEKLDGYKIDNLVVVNFNKANTIIRNRFSAATIYKIANLYKDWEVGGKLANRCRLIPVLTFIPSSKNDTVILKSGKSYIIDLDKLLPISILNLGKMKIQLDELIESELKKIMK